MAVANVNGILSPLADAVIGVSDRGMVNLLKSTY